MSVRRIMTVAAILVLLASTGMASFHASASASREPSPPFCGAEEPEAIPLTNHYLSGPISGALILAGGTWNLFEAQVSGAVDVRADTDINIEDSTIEGAIVTATGDNVFVCQSTIGGSLTANNYPASVTSCQSTFGGAITVYGSTGFVLIGDTLGDFDCGTNLLTSHGSNNFINNTGDIEVGGNQIAGSMVMIGNSGKGPLPDASGPEIEDNTIAGALNCIANSPAPIDDSQPDSVAGSRTGQCSASGF